MTENQIIILCFMGFWIFAGILTYTLLLRYTREEYKRFYPHPIVNIVKEITGESEEKCYEKMMQYKNAKKASLSILSGIDDEEELNDLLAKNSGNLRKVLKEININA